MGQTDELPDTDVFSTCSLSKMEPQRVAGVVENYFYTPRSVTRATRDFIPRATDVILATNPKTGDAVVLRMLRLVNCKTREEFDEMAKIKSSDQVPWIESRFVDGDPEVLNSDQPGLHRLFKTHTAAQGLSVKRKNAPLFVTIARHPLDVRVAWFKHIHDCYRVGGNDNRANFAAIFTLDDWVDVTPSSAQINPLAKILTLEHIMIDWYLESKKNKRVFQIYFEQLVTDPKPVVRELGEFLGTSLSEERIDQIVKIIQREYLDALIDETTGYMYGYYACERIFDRWRRALESTQAPADFGKSYEDFYYQATGTVYPFPKTYPTKPPGKGPLDKVGRNLEAAAKTAGSKCVVQ